MQEGTVKFFNEAKGFGFIKPNDGSGDVFVHITGIAAGAKLQENDKVSYDLQDGKKGPMAVNVQVAQ